MSNGCHRRSAVGFMKNQTLQLELEKNKAKIERALMRGMCFFSEGILGTPI